MTNSNKKPLIAYYSRKGRNYVGGNIIDLPVGNTEVVAQKIQSLVMGEMFHIETIKAYPTNYIQTTEIAHAELLKKDRPILKGFVDNMVDYDIIYLGYPNWWGTFPMAVFTFLESYDFSGKTIIPFCTHEGSGLGRSEKDIKKTCPKAIVKLGIAIKGGSVNGADEIVRDWIRKQSV